MRFIIVILGSLMAIADSVPGISGSTIAYSMGYYEEFIASIADLTKSGNRKKSINFIFNLGIGWVTGFICSILILSTLVESNIFLVSSLFFGLVLASIPATTYDYVQELLDNKKYVVFTIIGIIIVVLITNVSTEFINITDNVMDKNIATYSYFFLVAIVAISSMLLPGMSGSTVMLIFGVYEIIITMIKEFLFFNFVNTSFLVVFGVGVLLGMAVATKVIVYFFTKFKPQMIYLIQGLLIGSLYAIIQGPVKHYNQSLSIDNFSVSFFLIGIISIYLLHYFSKNK